MENSSYKNDPSYRDDTQPVIFPSYKENEVVNVVVASSVLLIFLALCLFPPTALIILLILLKLG